MGKFQDAKRAMRSKILGLTDRPGKYDLAVSVSLVEWHKGYGNSIIVYVIHVFISIGFPSSQDIAFAEVSGIDGKGMKEMKHKLKDLVDK